MEPPMSHTDINTAKLENIGQQQNFIKNKIYRAIILLTLLWTYSELDPNILSPYALNPVRMNPEPAP